MYFMALVVKNEERPLPVPKVPHPWGILETLQTVGFLFYQGWATSFTRDGPLPLPGKGHFLYQGWDISTPSVVFLAKF